MKKRLYYLIILVVGIVFLGSSQLTLAASRAETAEHCQKAQDYLQTTIKPRDIKGRVDRLQAYQYIYQELDGFARRLENNHQTGAKALRTELSTYDKLIERFKIDYEIYDQSRDATVRISNCQKNVDDFIIRLKATRDARAQLTDDITVLTKSINSGLLGQLKLIQKEL